LVDALTELALAILEALLFPSNTVHIDYLPAVVLESTAAVEFILKLPLTLEIFCVAPAASLFDVMYLLA
jgi:hypothetical protein